MKLFTTVLLVSLSLQDITAYAQSEPAADTISSNGNNFTKVDVEASFPGGESAWRKYLEQNLNANTPVDNGAPVGKFTIEIQFVVATDGTISDISELSKLGFGMEKEVVRIIKKSGLWAPAL
jgi:periplasmic protein TonB